MKNKNRTQILVLFSGFVCALVTPLVLVAASVPPADAMLAAAVAAESGQSTITGKVESKNDHSIRVDGKAVLVTDTTVIIRNGSPATLADVQLGDEVRATCDKAADGSLLAVRVDVTAAEL